MSRSAILNELLVKFAPPQRDALRQHYQVMTQLPGAATDLQQFLTDTLERLIGLFAATDGVIWMSEPAGGDRNSLPLSLRPHATIGLGPPSAGGDAATPRRQLIEFAATQVRSLVVAPHASPPGAEPISNPTESFVVLGPIRYAQQCHGVVELFLGAHPEHGESAADCQSYAVWLDHLVGYIGQGIELRRLGSAAPLQPALVNLAATHAEIEAFKSAIARSLEVTLNSYTGMSFGSLHNNQTFTRNVHELLEANGLRIACPECGAPAIVRCQPAGNSKTGVFLFDHYLDTGRTFHGGPSTFPPVKLVPKPPRRRAN